jgi:hypothetical protein
MLKVVECVEKNGHRATGRKYGACEKFSNLLSNKLKLFEKIGDMITLGVHRELWCN